MSYSFSGSQSLDIASAPAQASLVTIACWYQVTNAAVRQGLVYLGDSSGLSNRHFLFHESNGSVACATFATLDFGPTGVTSNTWTHGAVSIASSTSRLVYTNGVSGTISTTNLNPGTFTELKIGARPGGINMTGLIAEVGVWDIDLNADEIASLSDGMTCDKVRPQNLVFYAPLIRDLQDVSGGLTITNNNTATVAAHPRVYA